MLPFRDYHLRMSTGCPHASLHLPFSFHSNIFFGKALTKSIASAYLLNCCLKHCQFSSTLSPPLQMLPTATLLSHPVAVGSILIASSILKLSFLLLEPQPLQISISHDWLMVHFFLYLPTTLSFLFFLGFHRPPPIWLFTQDTVGCRNRVGLGQALWFTCWFCYFLTVWPQMPTLNLCFLVLNKLRLI